MRANLEKPRRAVGGGAAPAESSKIGPVALLLTLAAFTSSWTGASIGQVSVTDFLTIGATVLVLGSYLAGNRRVFIYWWMIAPMLGAFVIAAIDVLIRGASVDPGIAMMSRLFFGTTLLAILVWSETLRLGRGILWFLARWWAGGVVVNAIATILIGNGLLVVRGFIRQPPGDWRTSGLAFHPNSLALGLTISLPIIVLLIVVAKSNWGRFAWIVGGLFVVSALFYAASRAGILVGIPALGLALAVALGRSRARVFSMSVLILGIVAVYLWVVPALQGTRLSDQTGANSDVGRIEINDNAFRIITENPLFGGGFDAETGVALPLQILTIGGLTFAILYYTFLTVPAAALWCNRRTPAGSFGLVYLSALIAFGVLNPGVSDRASLWPLVVLGAGLMTVKDCHIDESLHQAVRDDVDTLRTYNLSEAV